MNESVVDNALFHQKNELMNHINQFTVEPKNIPFILDNIRQIIELLEFNAELWKALSYSYKMKEILLQVHTVLVELRHICHHKQLGNIEKSIHTVMGLMKGI